MAEVRALARGISEVAFVELTIFSTLRMRHDELSALIYDSERNATPVEMVTYRTLLSTRLLHLLRGEAGEILPMTLSGCIRLATLAFRARPLSWNSSPSRSAPEKAHRKEFEA